MALADQLGFLDLHSIQNIFTTEVDKIHEDVKINGLPTNKYVFFEMFDNIRLALLKNAKFNLQEYLKKNPDVKREIRMDRTAEETVQLRKSAEQRVKESRERAKAGE